MSRQTPGDSHSTCVPAGYGDSGTSHPTAQSSTVDGSPKVSSIEAGPSLRDWGVTLELGGHDSRTLAQADLIVVSPGVSLEQPVFSEAMDKGVETIGELELASRWLRGRVIAVTGTKGKSTTTTVIGRMAASSQEVNALAAKFGAI